jgi:hypothetical protein
MKFIGARGLERVGWQQGIETQSSFTREQSKEGVKTLSRDSWIVMVSGGKMNSHMGNAAIGYFNDIFSSNPCIEMDETIHVVESVVTEDMNQQLLSPFTALEIRQAAFQMNPSKAPGPDGMSSFFFQKFWHIIGEDVITAILSVLNSGHMLRKINHSHIVLIPKKQNPRLVAEYRPISLSNVVYKIISKVLANRLKTLLPNIISDSQSAFVPGRQITDNINVAFEMIHCLRTRRSGRNTQMALKLDMSKAYDRVEWDFLRKIMHKLGFDERWIQLVMMCVCTTSYSILLNGEPTGYITPTRGIRQGDPLSPYLFLLCAEGLSALLREAEMTDKIHGVAICRGGPKISHLLFADDSLLFCHAKVDECMRLLAVLEQYEKASGQVINKEKTALFFSKNTPEQTKSTIQHLWGVNGTSNFEKYLGLPAMVGRKKQTIFSGLKERVAHRIQGWKERLLSKAGREILIKSVAQSIPTYTMSCFKVPKGWCEDIQAMVANYWWGQQQNEYKIHWLSWGKLCKSKDDGGVGFRDLSCFNLALLAKQGWRLLTSPTSLFYRVYKSKYFPRCSFMKAKLGSNPSFIWRSMLAARYIIQQGVRWTVGNGQSIDIWNDDWGPQQLQKRSGSRDVARVDELIDTDRGHWNLPVLNEVFTKTGVDAICAINLPNVATHDSMVWKHTPSGHLSVRSAYHLAFSLKTNQDLIGSSSKEANRRVWKKLWQLRIPNKVKIHLWRACMDALPSRQCLSRRHLISDPLCPVCQSDSETVTHALWACPHARNVWALIPGRIQKLQVATVEFFLLTQNLTQSLNRQELELWAVTCWSIWNARNKFVHDAVMSHPRLIFDNAMRLLQDFHRVLEAQRIPPPS